MADPGSARRPWAPPPMDGYRPMVLNAALTGAVPGKSDNTLHSLAERGLVPDPPVVNVLLGSLGAAPAFVGDLARIVERLPAGAEWAAAGIGIYQRPMTIAAAIMDGNVRTGLEDDPKGDGTPEWGNVEAVRLARAAAELAGRRLASPAEARARFGLGPVAPQPPDPAAAR